MTIYVLGGGIIGLCSGISLLEQGQDVTILDRTVSDEGASAGNAGIISPWSVIPQSIPGLWKHIPKWICDPRGPVSVRTSYVPKIIPWGLKFLSFGDMAHVNRISQAMWALNQGNIGLYHQYLADTGKQYLVQDSYYIHAFRQKDKACLDNFDYQMRQDLGADIIRINADELQELEPALTTDYQAAIVIKGQARALSPAAICQALREKFQRLGGHLKIGTIQELRPGSEKSEWYIKTAETSYQANQILIALGTWSQKLLAPFGVKVPLEAERGYHVTFPNMAQQLTHSVMDMDMKFVASQMVDGIRVAGTAEFSGLDAPLNQKRLYHLTVLARKMLPDISQSLPKSWGGYRPSLPDSLPCLGRVSGYEGLYAAFGHSHYGLMMAPRTGRVMAQLMTGQEPDIDLKPFSLTRFKKGS